MPMAMHSHRHKTLQKHKKGSDNNVLGEKYGAVLFFFAKIGA
jgi:hypothetical protein